jgi:hypothetical protein
MIKDDKLSNILNDRLYKDSDDTSSESLSQDVAHQSVTECQTEQTSETNTEEDQYSLKDRILDIMEDLIRISCFGYATELFLSADWSLLGIFAVGYSISYVIDKIFLIFHRYNN